MILYFSLNTYPCVRHVRGTVSVSDILILVVILNQFIGQYQLNDPLFQYEIMQSLQYTNSMNDALFQLGHSLPYKLCKVPSQNTFICRCKKYRDPIILNDTLLQF